MPRITEDLLRKRAEHNEKMLSTLEEISLHQEELERLEVVGVICRKLKILLLQNNIIPKMEGLHHLKQLEYLNLALNNISKIEGLGSCEFLKKLDMTVNFVDVDTLEESMDNLQHLTHLRELYFMGNPCQVDWSGFNRYVIARLSNLEFLDGKEITRTERILASQEFPELQRELRILAQKKRDEKKKNGQLAESDEEDDAPKVEDVDDDVAVGTGDDEVTPYTPESRNEMYLELAEQKKEKEDREKERLPRERNLEDEHSEAVRKARDKESEIDPDKPIRQVNEGKLDFHFDEYAKPGFVVLNIGVPKFLDLSMIDVDVNPTYVSVVCKNKTLRLNWPEEVVPDAGKAERSKVTGMLCITVPKLDSKAAIRALKEQKWEEEARREKVEQEKENKEREIKGGQESSRPLKMAEQMMKESKAVKINSIIKNSPNAGNQLLKEVKTSKAKSGCSSTGEANVQNSAKKQHHVIDGYDDDDAPPLM
jgi:protein TilB